jgi:hypothetical protein
LLGPPLSLRDTVLFAFIDAVFLAVVQTAQPRTAFLRLMIDMRGF